MGNAQRQGFLANTRTLATGVFCALGLVLFAGGSMKGVGPSPPKEGNPTLSFRDTEGRVQTPLSQPDKKATILFFLLPDCPISNSYAPEIQRICKDYEAKKIAAFVIHADPDVTAEDAKKHAATYGLACPVLRDPSHLLVKRTGVTMAPEVAVLAPNGSVVYRGRIDNMYVDYGKRLTVPTQRDLRRALDEILDGKKVSIPTTRVLGCDLPEQAK